MSRRNIKENEIDDRSIFSINDFGKPFNGKGAPERNDEKEPNLKGWVFLIINLILIFFVLSSLPYFFLTNSFFWILLIIIILPPLILISIIIYFIGDEKPNPPRLTLKRALIGSVSIFGILIICFLFMALFTWALILTFLISPQALTLIIIYKD